MTNKILEEIEIVKREIANFDLVISKINFGNDSALDIADEIREEKYPFLVKLDKLQKSNPDCTIKDLISTPIGEIYWDDLYNFDDEFEFKNLKEFNEKVIPEIQNRDRDTTIQVLGKFEKDISKTLVKDYFNKIESEFKISIPFDQSGEFESFMFVSSVKINNEDVKCIWVMHFGNNIIQNKFLLIKEDEIEIIDIDSAIFKSWYLNEFKNHDYNTVLIIT